MRTSLAAIALLLASATGASAQSADTGARRYPLDGRHEIRLTAGLLTEIGASTTASNGSAVTETNATAMGSFGWWYWLQERLAVGVSAGFLDANVSTSAGVGAADVETAVVTSLLFGLKQQPFALTPDDKLRPYVAGAVGPFVGVESRVRGGAQAGTESITETALGARLGGGLDLSLGRSFRLGISAGYRWVSDFDRRIGTDENYSGPEFALGAGLLLGRGR